MRREHLVRILREVVNAEGAENDPIVTITSKELESIDRDCEVMRDATRGKTKPPVLNIEEWALITEQLSLNWRDWKSPKMEQKWIQIETVEEHI